MRIETIEIAQIKPAEYNPRKDLQPGHPRYEAIKQSIETWDLREPLIWNQRTGNLVSGHQRLKILQELGRTEVETSIVDLSPVEEKAMNIAINRAQGEWAEEELDLIVAELAAQGMAEAATYRPEEIDDLLLKLKVQNGEADYQELMGPAVDRPDQAPASERIEVILRAGPDVLTPARIKQIRGTWAHLGIEVQVKEGQPA